MVSAVNSRINVSDDFVKIFNYRLTVHLGEVVTIVMFQVLRRSSVVGQSEYSPRLIDHPGHTRKANAIAMNSGTALVMVTTMS